MPFMYHSNTFTVRNNPNIYICLSNDEIGHGPVLHDFVAWCDRSYLCLNATKTKDMCIDFRKHPPSQSDTVIHDNKVEVVD